MSDTHLEPGSTVARLPQSRGETGNPEAAARTESDGHAGPALEVSGLSVSGLSVSFGGVVALEGVSVEVSKGEVLGVIGPNGAGKTTLFNAICGFVTPDAGTIIWGGASLAGIRPDRLAASGIARTLQGVGLFGGLSVLENVMVGAQRFRRAGLVSALLALPRSDFDERSLRGRAVAALERVSCQEFVDRLPGTLPYAIQKRVALARALVCEPELLLLDEPAGGLGASDLSDLSKLIDTLRSTIAVMLVDHHMDLVSSVCDRLVVLDFGRIIASGEPPVVRNDPAVLEAYLGRSTEDDEPED
jgi:branched-chain amino acid transport system ATP-binding protein